MKNNEITVKLISDWDKDFKYFKTYLEMIQRNIVFNCMMKKDFTNGRYFVDLFGNLQIFLSIDEEILNIMINKESSVIEYDFLDLKDQNSNPLKYYNQSKIIINNNIS